MASSLPFFCLLVLWLGLQAAPSAAQRGGKSATPADALCSDPRFKTLCRIILAAGDGQGATALQNPKSVITVFAPTDEAFGKDGKNTTRRLKLKDFNDIFTTPTAADRLLRGLIIPVAGLLTKALQSGNKYMNGLGLQISSATWSDQIYTSSPELKREITKTRILVGQAVLYIVNSSVPFVLGEYRRH
ncbi:hypothetical protein TSOC_001029 [Tetrabaena socialis]|uniref:FAS1 domain-containing protein n=1 Tax=Tetrabaena socialis TaxID=47790 RepID=A0A2J8AHU0_9CHLO|nr:hypothetical protein TSOC_001029 [Tetrabaena socialis]|eukprot:PNH12082.1 hypothetical protein TSOC_001029 [Tetrabaena socialis]